MLVARESRRPRRTSVSAAIAGSDSNLLPVGLGANVQNVADHVPTRNTGRSPVHDTSKTPAGSSSLSNNGDGRNGPRRRHRTIGSQAWATAGTQSNSPSVLKSSSASVQWMPKPSPAFCQLARWSGVACARRGYQASGTAMVRPSIRSTISRCSSQRTSSTRSSYTLAKKVMPRLQQRLAVVAHQPDMPAISCARKPRLRATSSVVSHTSIVASPAST